jgi:hypothetical protein
VIHSRSGRAIPIQQWVSFWTPTFGGPLENFKLLGYPVRAQAEAEQLGPS